MTARRIWSGRIWCCVLLAPPISAAAQPDAQVLTAEDLAQAGAMRLGDIFALADGWTANSTSGYTWDAAAVGTAPFGPASWKVFVDESHVDLRLLGGQDINTLAISVTEVCRVEIHTRPTFVAGVFAGSGAIHFHTCRPPPGVSMGIAAGAGSQTGDPGPFKYTPLGGPNVDRSGPVLQGAAAISGSAWSLRLQGRADEHHATDARIRDRVHTLYVGEKDARIFHTSARATLARTGERSGHRLVAGAARSEDLAYYEALALEVPANHEVLEAGISGNFPIRPALQLHYRLRAQRSELVTRPNPDSLDLDWRHETLRTYAALRYQRKRTSGEFGAGAVQHRAAMATVPRQAAVESFGTVAAGLGSGLSARASARLQAAEGRIGRVFRGAITWRADRRQEAGLALTALRQVPAIERPLWYWIAEGYDAARFEGAPLAPAALRAASLEASWRLRPGARLRLGVSATLWRYRNMPAEAHEAAFDPATTGLIVRPAVRESWGYLANLAVTAHFRPTDTFSLKGFGAYTYPRSRDALFVHASRQQPTVMASVTARLRPNDRFSLFARLRYRAATQWPLYRYAAIEAPLYYASSLPARAVLDFTAQKRFWRDHMRLGASLRNALDHAYLLHPAGGTAGLALHFYVQLFTGR